MRNLGNVIAKLRKGRLTILFYMLTIVASIVVGMALYHLMLRNLFE